MVFLRAHAPTTRVGRELQVVEAEGATGSSQVLTGLAVLHAMLGQHTECERALSEADRRMSVYDRVMALMAA